jgi:exopolysaccharide biosynthesis polyprenyl glycosylphosphotransferase
MAQVMFRKISSIMALSDAILLAGVLAAAFLFKFGLLEDSMSMKNPGLLRFAIPTILQPVYSYLIWLVSLIVLKSRDQRVLGSDTQEYKRVVMAGLAAPAFFAVASLIFKVDVSRGYLIATVSVGTIALLANRWFWRNLVVRQRARGSMLSKVALLGPKNQTEKFASKLLANPAEGYHPVLLLTDSGEQEITQNANRYTEAPFGPDAVSRITNSGCKTVIVFGSDKISDHNVRSLAWQLEGTDVELLIAPPLEDVAVSRLAVRPVAGVPVFVVEVPKFKGQRHFVKFVFDLVLASVLLVLSAPIALFFALLVKAEDGGPMFFRQPRVGLNGKEFKMFKLRSMRVGADLEHAQMVAAANTSPNAVLYKNPKDPRVTRVGQFIRRWSIDELPQFLNVLRGEMSLVGPRPPLPSEVAIYESHVHRRLLVKPGITGLWQVSGKNALTWEETVALDLNYVDNWSLIGDVLLILKTFKAVFSPEIKK